MLMGSCIRQEPRPQDALSTLGSLWHWGTTPLRFSEALLCNAEFLQGLLFRALESLRSVWNRPGGTALDLSEVSTERHTVTPWIWSLPWSPGWVWELLNVWRGWGWGTILYLTVCPFAHLSLLTFYHRQRAAPRCHFEYSAWRSLQLDH